MVIRTGIQLVPRALKAKLRVDNFRPHELELADRLPELFSLLREANARVQHKLHRTDLCGENTPPSQFIE